MVPPLARWRAAWSRGRLWRVSGAQDMRRCDNSGALGPAAGSRGVARQPGDGCGNWTTRGSGARAFQPTNDAPYDETAYIHEKSTDVTMIMISTSDGRAIIV